MTEIELELTNIKYIQTECHHKLVKLLEKYSKTVFTRDLGYFQLPSTFELT